MFLEWQPIYSVNVKEIDEQHKKIFAILNQIFTLKKNLAQSIPTREEVSKVLNELKDYSIYHFGTEEKYFKEFNFPDQTTHIAQHEQYKKSLSELEKKWETSAISEVVGELADFLQGWWLGHIQNSDVQYTDFFNQKGLY